MMDASPSVSAMLVSPPMSLSHPSDLNFVQLDDNTYIADADGTTYCVYDPSSTFTYVLQGVDGNEEQSETVTYAFAEEPEALPTDDGNGNKVYSMEVELPKLADSNHDHDDLVAHIKTEPGEYPEEQQQTFIITQEIADSIHGQNEDQPNGPPDTTTFYSDMAVALSDDSETHETYLPYSFDEASHFLFHGREECVISTDIPTIETSSSISISSSSTSNNSFDSNISSSSVKKKKSKSKPSKPRRINEGITVNRQVYKCPYTDCKFWAARGHRFHEHMCTHDSVRPFGCSQCSYETNWKSDVKKHIARMIERNAKDHESAVLTKISDKQIDTNCYKDYLVSMDIPCHMFSGRVGQSPRCGHTGNKKVKTGSGDQGSSSTNEPQFSDFADFISSRTNSTCGSISPTPVAKKSKPKKTKTKTKAPAPIPGPEPVIVLPQIAEVYQDPKPKPTAEETLPTPTEVDNASVTIPSSEIFTSAEEVVEAAPAVTEQDHEPIKQTVPKVGFQETITTDDGIKIRIVPASVSASEPQAKAAPVKAYAKPKKSPKLPTATAKPHSVTTPRKPRSAAAKAKPSEVWECTRCDYFHASKSNVLNHMFRYHKLYGTTAKPTLNARRRSIPVKRSIQADTTQQPARNLIVRGEDQSNFHQYFLVVENGTVEDSTTRRGQQPQHIQPKFNCDTCPYVAEDGRSLMQHRKFHGSLDETLTYSCPHCNFKSAVRRDMEQHKNLHAKVVGKQIKLNDYSRTKKRSEKGKNDIPAKISKR